MLTSRARSLFPPWVSPADQCAALRALAVYAAQSREAYARASEPQTA